jgi:hypothetical protein
MQPYQRSRVSILGAAIAATAVSWGFVPGSAAQEAPRKVVMRFASDFTPPPHPAGMALKQKRVSTTLVRFTPYPRLSKPCAEAISR